MSAKAAMAELLGKATGCSKGKGGSMHFFDAEKGFLGGHAIVGSHIPLAAGRRLRHQVSRRGPGLHLLLRRRRDEPGVGPRGVQHGGALEAAGHLRRREQPVRDGHLARAVLGRARPDGPRRRPPTASPGVSINGNDIELMAKTTREAANRARAGEGPTFIEAKTYRFKGHSISDPAKYRLKDELDVGHQERPDRRLSERPQGARLDRRRRRSSGMRDERQGRGRREHRVRRAEPSRPPRSRSTKTSRWPRTSRRSDHGRCLRSAKP